MHDFKFTFKEKVGHYYDWSRLAISPMTKFNHAVSFFQKRKQVGAGLTMTIYDKYGSWDGYYYQEGRTIAPEGYRNFGKLVWANSRFFDEKHTD